MTNLIKNEYRQFRSRRIVLWSVLFVAAIAFAGSATNILGQTFQSETNAEDFVRGLEAIRLEQAIYKKLPSALSEELLSSAGDAIGTAYRPENLSYTQSGAFYVSNDVYYKYILPYGNIYDMLETVYGYDTAYPQTRMARMDGEDAKRFYAQRALYAKEMRDIQGGRELFRMDRDQLQSKSVELADKMDSKIEMPFRYGYFAGWEAMTRSLRYLFALILFVIAFCLTTIFSGDLQNNMASIILTSKYGRSEWIRARILAMLSVSAGIFVLGVLIYTGLDIFAFGSSGYNLPIQLSDLASCVPLTFLQTYLCAIGIGLLGILAFTSFAFFLSAFIGNSHIIVCILLGSVIFSLVSRDSFGGINALIPTGMISAVENLWRTNLTFGIWRPIGQILSDIFWIVLLIPISTFKIAHRML